MPTTIAYTITYFVYSLPSQSLVDTSEMVTPLSCLNGKSIHQVIKEFMTGFEDVLGSTFISETPTSKSYIHIDMVDAPIFISSVEALKIPIKNEYEIGFHIRIDDLDVIKDPGCE